MGCWASAEKSQKDDLEYDQAILQLKVSRDRVKKYQQRLESDNEKQLQLAVKLAKEGKKDRAKLVIKAKKAREAMILKADGMLTTLQEQLNNLENAKITKDFADSLQTTNNVLKEMNEKLTVEMVEELMNENQEQADKINEISELLGQNMNPQDEADAEEEYERMLAQLNAEEGGEQQNQTEQHNEEEQEQIEEQQQEEQPQRVAQLA